MTFPITNLSLTSNGNTSSLFGNTPVHTLIPGASSEKAVVTSMYASPTRGPTLLLTNLSGSFRITVPMENRPEGLERPEGELQDKDNKFMSPPRPVKVSKDVEDSMRLISSLSIPELSPAKDISIMGLLGSHGTPKSTRLSQNINKMILNSPIGRMIQCRNMSLSANTPFSHIHALSTQHLQASLSAEGVQRKLSFTEEKKTR